jgi:hypothetical protein
VAAAASLVVGLMAPALPTTAQTTITVTRTDDIFRTSDPGSNYSLREAIEYAPTGSIIQLQALTYEITRPRGGEDRNVRGDLDVVGKSLTIRGVGAGQSVIRSSITSNDQIDLDRVLDVQPGAGLILEDLTVTGGRSQNPGGGIRNNGGTLSLTRVIVEGNSNNLSPSGSDGGGIWAGGTTNISLSVIASNSTRDSGGGIFNAITGTLTLDRSTVSNNSTNNFDGAGLANLGTATVSNSTFSGNSSNRNGGGMANGFQVDTSSPDSSGTLTVINATVTGNTADADANIGGQGGGIFNWVDTAGAVTLRNVIVAGNFDLTPGGGAGIRLPDLNAQTPNTIAGNSNNLIGSRDGIVGYTTVGGATDIVSPTGGIQLSPLANNGGLTRTHLPSPTSPAVDQANNSTCQNAPIGNQDQRGKLRPADGDANNTDICDIGSVEIQSGIVVLNGSTVLADNAALNLGETSRGIPISTTLTISNTGDATLSLGSPSVPPGVSAGSFGTSLVAPGAATTLVLTLNATAQGGVGGQLSFETNDPALAGNNGDFRLNLTGNVTQALPTIVVEVDGQVIPNGGVIDNFNTVVGTPITRTITIRNTGDENLPLNTPSLGTDFTISDFASSVDQNSFETFDLGFDAENVGVVSQIIALTSSDPRVTPFTFTVIGAAVPGTGDAQIVVRDGTNLLTTSGGTADFGRISVGQPVTKTLTIHNFGGGTLEITRPLLISTGDYSIARQPGGSSSGTVDLAAGEVTTVTVVLNASSSSVAEILGTLTISNSDSARNPFQVNLRATVPPVVTLFENSTLLPSGGSLNFGSAPQGFPLTRTFTISNTGGPATLTPPAPINGYTVTGFPTSVGANSSATFTVQLNATPPVGPKVGTLAFTIADQGSYSVSLSGEVTPAPGNVSLNFGGQTVQQGGTVNFGTSPVGKPTKRNFTISNTGALTLTVNAFNLPTGGFALDPSVSFPLQIAPGASVTVPVILTGAAKGNVGGLATIASDDPDASQFQFTLNATIGDFMFYLPIVARNTGTAP